MSTEDKLFVIAGELSATHTVIAMLIDEMASSDPEKHSLIVNRLQKLMKAMPTFGNDPRFSTGAGQAFSSILHLLTVTGDEKPEARWTPEVIDGGRTDDE